MSRALQPFDIEPIVPTKRSEQGERHEIAPSAPGQEEIKL